ncbi:MAG: hypothetical protein ACE5LU_26390, partial [Anaerolineae bacterium]
RRAEVTWTRNTFQGILVNAMPSKEFFSDLYLAIQPQTAGMGSYVLKAYDALPAESEQPLASAALPPLDYKRLSKSLADILAGDLFARHQMGDYLAEWLFMAPSDTNEQERQYNPVGACLQERTANLERNHRLRLWICVDPTLLDHQEFRGYLPFECLEHNSRIPVRIVRGAVPGRGERPYAPTAAEPLEVTGKLRVLLVYANPDKDKASHAYPHLDHLGKHFDVLFGALDPLVHAGELFIDVLRQPTPE